MLSCRSKTYEREAFELGTTIVFIFEYPEI